MDIDQVSSDGDDGWDELDGEDDEFAEVFRSLFSGAEFPCVDDALKYDTANHGFNFAEFRKQVSAPTTQARATPAFVTLISVKWKHISSLDIFSTDYRTFLTVARRFGGNLMSRTT